MSINYDWSRSEENPLISYETLVHLKTGLEAAFGGSFDNFKSIQERLDKIDGGSNSDYNLAEQVKKNTQDIKEIKDDINSAVAILEEIV